MTLIAIYNYKNSGPNFFLGDGLITSEYEPTSKVRLPTRDSFYDSTMVGHSHIVSFQQKVIVVNPKLVVAWTGNLCVAKALLDDLFENLGDESSITEINVERYLASTKAGKCLIIGAFLDENENEQIFSIGHSRNLKTPKLPGIDYCVVSGTGYRDFIALKEKGLTIKSLSVKHGCVTDTDLAIMQSICDFSEMLFEEMKSGDNLWGRYGAFYELAWNNGNGYSKFSDILFFMVHYNITADTFRADVLFYKYDVVSTTTIIRTVSCRQDPDGTVKPSFRGNIITSIIAQQNRADKYLCEHISTSSIFLGDKNIGLPDLKASTISVLVHALDGKGNETFVPFIRCCPRDEAPVILEKHAPNFIRIGLKQEFIDAIKHYTVEHEKIRDWR